MIVQTNELLADLITPKSLGIEWLGKGKGHVYRATGSGARKVVAATFEAPCHGRIQEKIVGRLVAQNEFRGERVPGMRIGGRCWEQVGRINDAVAHHRKATLALPGFARTNGKLQGIGNGINSLTEDRVAIGRDILICHLSVMGVGGKQSGYRRRVECKDKRTALKLTRVQIEEPADPGQRLIAGRGEVDLFCDLLVLNNSDLQKLVLGVAQNAVWKMVVDIAIARDRREDTDRICPGDTSKATCNLAMLKPIESLVGCVGVIGQVRKEHGHEVREEPARITARIVVQVVRTQKDFQVGRNVPQQLTANVELVGTVSLAADRDVLDECIAMVDVDREFDCEGVGYRAGDISTSLNGVVVAIAHLRFACEVETRRQRVNNYGAASHVASKKGALRPSQDFNLAQIKQVRVLVAKSGGRYAVDKGRHRVVPPCGVVVDERTSNGQIGFHRAELGICQIWNT